MNDEIALFRGVCSRAVLLAVSLAFGLSLQMEAHVSGEQELE